MKLRSNKEGAVGPKMLLVLGIIAVVVMLYLSGMIAIGIPGIFPGTDNKYEETVVRRPTDIGIIVPLNVKLSFYQKAGSSSSDVDVSILHRHEELGADDNHVPNPEVINALTYNTKVGIVGDSNTQFAVNGNGFTASDRAFDTTLIDDSGINYGLPQNNIKVWTKSNVYVPPSPGSTPKSNGHVIFIQATFEHYQKATQYLLSSDVVTFAIHYSMPDYNKGNSYSKGYIYYIYVPFNDFAPVEDIEWRVVSYKESCLIGWREVTKSVRQFWGLKLFGIEVVGIVKQVDTTTTAEIEYYWKGPRAEPIRNGETYGSHSYLYKIR